MKLFDDIHRNDDLLPHVWPPVTTTFRFLNTSSKTRVEERRQMLELWFSALPRDAKAEIRPRFRSLVDTEHERAFLELFIYELMTGLGFKPSFRPPVLDLAAGPDFQLCVPGVGGIYAESTVIGGSRSEKSRQERIACLLDRLDSKLGLTDFWLDVELAGYPVTPPPSEVLAYDLSEWMHSLDWVSMWRRVETGDGQNLPHFPWSHAEWDLVFTAIPKNPPCRGTRGIRPIGSESIERRGQCTRSPIKSRILTKGRKLRGSQKPCILVVNILDQVCDEGAVGDALFGDRANTKQPNGDVVIHYGNTRKPNGALYGPFGPVSRSISCVLIASRLGGGIQPPYAPRLWHNPWAEHPVNPTVWPLPQMIVSRDSASIERRDGNPLSNYLRSPDYWFRTLKFQALGEDGNHES